MFLHNAARWSVLSRIPKSRRFSRSVVLQHSTGNILTSLRLHNPLPDRSQMLPITITASLITSIHSHVLDLWQASKGAVVQLKSPSSGINSDDMKLLDVNDSLSGFSRPIITPLNYAHFLNWTTLFYFTESNNFLGYCCLIVVPSLDALVNKLTGSA